MSVCVEPSFVGILDPAIFVGGADGSVVTEGGGI